MSQYMVPKTRVYKVQSQCRVQGRCKEEQVCVWGGASKTS
jgi:hypothetical protein